MKAIKIILILLMVSIGQGVFGQSRPKKDTTSFISLSGSYALATLPPSSLVWTSFGMKWKPIPNINNADSIYIYVRKSQLRWINDSTAVIQKSN